MTSKDYIQPTTITSLELANDPKSLLNEVKEYEEPVDYDTAFSEYYKNSKDDEVDMEEIFYGDDKK